MFVLLLAAPAYASYEPVETFGEGAISNVEGGPKGPKAEEGVSQPTGIAVNNTTGDVYVVDQGKNRVMRFASHGNFREAWGWGVGDGNNEYERCGPDGEIARCKGTKENTSPDVPEDNGAGIPGEGVGQFKESSAIAVDQSTGDVYVVSGHLKGDVQVFSGKGRFIGDFGEVDSSSEAVSNSPEKLHEGINDTGLAVDGATGDVYIQQTVFLPQNPAESRVMVFEPQSPGDYEHYLYAGQSHDLFTGAYSEYARALALDPSGDFYVSHDEILYRFAKGNLATPAWAVPAPEGGGMAVEPVTGDLLRYATHSTKIERFSAVNGKVIEKFGTGETGLGLINGVLSLALNPNLSWAPGRPPGILYGDLSFTENHTKEARVLALTQLPVAPPKVDAESASFVGSSSATLTAQINPDGYETRFRFQYGTEACSSHPCGEAPLGGADLGAGSADLAAGMELSGLAPETTYHYRVLATNLFGSTVEGAEQTFTTYPLLAPGLPDGRVYEMVSPPEKSGGEVFSPEPKLASCTECKPGENSAMDPMQSAADGNEVAYEGTPFARTGDAIEQNEYLSRRTATGWRTEDLSPTTDPSSLPYGALSADLSTGVLPWESNDPLLSPEAPSGYANLYLRGADGTMRPLLTAPPSGAGGLVLRFAGASAASADFSHVVFEANYALTGATAFAPASQEGAAGKYNVYEWFDGQLRLVNVLPGNTATVPDASLGEQPENSAAFDATNAVSRDGSRIFWTDEKTGQVYVRENGEATVEVPDPARFLAASRDGSKVLLRDGLVFDLSGGTPVESANLSNGLEGFQGMLGSSEDLSRVYFVDTEVLTGEEQNGQGAVAQSGADNVYLYEAGSGSTRFIATLLQADDSALSNGLAGDWQPSASERLAQVTPDGRYLAFMSHAQLTPYMNGGEFEVFEYDAETSRLSCVSCSPTGVPPLGESRLSLIRPITTKFPQPRNLSDNGRVFFDSRDVLSPLDGNGSIEDVYEWEPEGVGSCVRAGGCVFLISSGHSPADSNFIAASPSGGDVFFATRDRLVPADQDQLYDLYDARMGGGFPELTVPSCTGTGCQGVPGAPPIFATPSSATFSGVGNFETAAATEVSGKAKAKKKPAKCPKGRELRRSRCVKARAGGSKAHKARHGAGRQAGGRGR